MDKFIDACSWVIASELARAMPALRVFHTHPGGGLYDVLAVVGPGVDIQINRSGSIHVMGAGDATEHPTLGYLRWQQRLVEGVNPQEIAKEVAREAGIPWPSPRPKTVPHVLCYRVIARLLSTRLTDAEEWTATTQFIDTAGEGGGLFNEVPSVEMSAIPANHVWMISRDTTPVAWLWDGWGWNSNHERINLQARYRQGSTLDSLVAELTHPPAPDSATTLPLLGEMGAQPEFAWPGESFE